MKDNRYRPALSSMYFIMLIVGILVLPGSASLVSDPYSDSCVFDGDQVEEALIQPELSSEGMFCVTIDPDNRVMIGEYIRDTYPDIWPLLSKENQDYYNSVAAVWPCGEDEPMLPNEVIRLLWLMQEARTVSPALHDKESQLTGFSIPLKPVLPAIGHSLPIDSSSPGSIFDVRTPDVINDPEITRMRVISTPAISSFRFQEVQSGASLTAVFDARTPGTTLPKLTRPF